MKTFIVEVEIKIEAECSSQAADIVNYKLSGYFEGIDITAAYSEDEDQ